MLATLCIGFALAALAPLICRLTRGAVGWFIGLLIAGLCVHLARLAGPVLAGETVRESWSWIPSLGVNLSFHMDGLALVFALLISGIGALVALYAGGYLAGHPQLGRFYLYLVAFMSSMLGVVLSDNVLSLFVFWELTSLSSYFLIGFKHEDEESRAAALQALLVTGGGGLVLLAGLVLLGIAGGSYELSVLAGAGATIRQHQLYPAILVLVAIGGFTKSAQFPFHFWLPNAMAAPSPVSAYLHSSTMVKAGVYLLARMTPILGGTLLWTSVVAAVGAITMLAGGYLALVNRDLKKILAYSTVAMLGAMTMLLGAGTEKAVAAAGMLILAHALYKAALFLMAGAVDHEAGTRDIRQLGGLWRVMPITAVAGLLAALSSAGIPFTFGYLTKEMVYEAVYTWPGLGILAIALTVVGNIAMVAVAGMVVLKPFLGPARDLPKSPHEAPVSMWIGTLLLAALGVAAALFPKPMDGLISAFANAVTRLPADIHLALWHGFGPVLLFSAITLAGGMGLYLKLGRVSRWHQNFVPYARWGADQLYERLMAALVAVARLQTRGLQNGYLRVYVMAIIAVTVGLASTAMIRHSVPITWPRMTDVSLEEMAVVVIVLASAILAIRSIARLTVVAALGGVGYGVALIFTMYSAPDLSITQFAIETLTVILFVLVLYRLPRFVQFANWKATIRDVLIAGCAGLLITILLLVVTSLPAASRLTPYFWENSLPLGKGRNVVNVILVDFRALDTMGEITVLAIAAIGVSALLRLRLGREELP